MKSLRSRLLVSLWLAVVVVGAVSVGVVYWQANVSARKLMDGQLVQIAKMLGSQPSDVGSTADSDEEDIEVATWDRDSHLNYASRPFMARSMDAPVGFSQRTFDAEPYRLYAAMLSGRRVVLAQPIDTRDDMAERAAFSALLPVAVLLPVLAIVIGFVIRALLEPLREAAAAVSRHAALSRNRLDPQRLPSEIVPLVEEINRLLLRQGAAVERERQFVADAAHALRTPLAALQLQADVLDGSPQPTERAARLTELRAGIQRATRLVDELLTLARSEAGEESQGSADVDATLEGVRGLYLALAESHDVSIDIEADTQALVAGDARKLKLIGVNLLDNALRYTPSGGVVTMRAQSLVDKVQIEIVDAGPGIPEAELSRVFERFYRVDADSSTGTGLGLATVASLVGQLQGTVTLHNRTDRSGLIARVLLPRLS